MNLQPTKSDLAALARLEAAKAKHMGGPQTREALRAAVIDAARAFEGVSEIGVTNTGWWVNKFHAEVGLRPGSAWCGMLAQYALRVPATWLNLPDPLPRNTGATQLLAEWAEEEGLLVVTLADVKPGDLIIWRNGRNSRYGHVGIVIAVSLNAVALVTVYRFTTVEGNTSARNYRDGGTVAVKQYAYEAADLGRWNVRDPKKRYLRCVVSFDKLYDRYVQPEA